MTTTSKVDPLTPAARKALESANAEAKQLGSATIGSEHLLLGLIADQNDVVAQTLNAFYTTNFLRSSAADGMAGKIRKHLPAQSPITSPVLKLPMNTEANAILTQAKKDAETANSKTIGTEHLLSAIIKSNSAAKNFLIFFALNLPALEKTIQDNKKAAKDAVAAGCGVSTSSKTQNNVAARIFDTTAAVMGAAATVAGAATTVAGAVSDAIKTAKNSRNSTAMTRDEWVAVLDKAIDLSKKTGISVPACFIETAILSQSTVDRLAANQIRTDTLHDLVQSLLDQQKK